MNDPQQEPEAIAVIGMSGRFPHAENPEEFWGNLISGRDCVTRFGDRTDADGRRHVGARSILDRPDLFDAAFFGIYPKEAELMDPQHRVFLECAWEALEDGGCDPAAYSGMIGVYAGLSLNTYLLHNIGDAAHLAENYQVGEYQKMLGNDKDFLPVRVSYKLNLRGPSMAIQTACSTSLVAICQAATALLTYQTDLALAGGVSVSFPQERHYLFTEEGMVSPDGTCRAFDAQAAGTVFGHGCGVVLLKRLSEAIADGDPVLAVIKGWAVNNDGSDKIGFAAPGVNAQAEVISMAQAAAGVNPWDISYVEAHGTGTPLGDPIEVAALTKAFRDGGSTANQFCAIGTGKTHIGHLDVAAGVTGLIKTILQFRHGKIPALLHFQSPNPHIDFAGSPFSPVSEEREWTGGNAPRIAGVSAFGVGGTNAHVIVQEPPAAARTAESARPVLLTLSAKTEASLDLAANRLADHLEAHQPSLSDTAFTLATARRGFPLRRSIAAQNLGEAITKLRASAGKATASAEGKKIAFLFPGQGSQYGGMTREIYDAEPVFRAAMDECAGILSPLIREDIRSILYPPAGQEESALARMDQTALTQPCIFAVEYSLARLIMSWGIQPSLLIGHSIGEYVAAVLAGTFPLRNALQLLSRRAALMQDLPGGSMLAIRAGADEITLPEGTDLAAVNSPKLCTVSGESGAILAFQQSLEASGIASRVLKTSHAFHSVAMEPITGVFRDEAARIHASAPAIPWISTCTGGFIDSSVLADPSYWSRQLRQPVLFSDALATAFASGEHVFLEIGPGQALAQFARQHPQREGNPVIATLPSSGDAGDPYAALGELWNHGVTPDWTAFYRNESRSRIHLPTYSFDRRSFWIDNSARAVAATSTPFPEPLPAPLPAPTPMTLPDPSEKLRALILELSGVPVEDDSATFTELGFDSLFLTQASQAIHSAFGVKVTFRQMLGKLSSVAAISKHIQEVAPQPLQAAAPAPVAAAPTLSAPTGGGTALENALNQQIALIQNLIAQQRAPQPAATQAGNLTPVKWPERFPRSGAAANSRFGPYKPIEKGENGGLTQQQQKGLLELVSRYVRKTPGSKVYAAEHRAHYADPRAVAGFKSLWKEMVYPIVSARSKGGRIWDIDGNEYVDITMGFGTYFFGHSPDWLIPAIEEQLKTGIEIGPQSPIAGKLAAAIAELTNMDRVTFCNTGSEAVMAAMRLARTITGRQRIAYFTGDYHGMFEEVLVRGAWVDGVYKAQPIAPGIPQSLVENMLVLDYADPASLEILKAHAHELAAVMVEPVQSRAPGLQPREFMHQVRAITKEAGTALIFDEVVTGFRCHPGGAQAYFGVEADLSTYGKVIGGGMPIGVLAGKREYMDALDGGAWNYGDDSFPEVGVTFFAGTFVRHPLALAAAWRVIEHLKGEGPRLQIEVEERVARFCRTLNDHFAAIGVPIRIPHFSAHAVIEHAPDLKYASLLWYFLREKGVHIWEGRPLYFTSAHTDADLDHMVTAFVEAVHEMQAAGFLPASTTTDVQPPAGFPRSDSAPTTEAQREIFHAVQMGDEANCSFNESNVIRLSGELDVSAMKAALADIVVRHPALRSTISAAGATQFFHPSAKTVEITEHNFAGPGGAESRSATLPLSLLKEAESSTPFDLANGPLVRFQLVHLSSVRHELIFTAHHIICDGWSFGMIIAELGAAYNARKAGRLPMLAPAMSFADYARLEVSQHLSDERESAEAFWVDKFSEPAPVLELPTDHPRPLMKSYRGSMESITLCGDRYARLKKAAPKLGGTLFSTLLASFATLLHRLTTQEDIVIGVPAAGQTRIGRDELVGHCLNFLPLRLKPATATPFDRFAADVKEQVLEAYDHQNYTFGSLLRKIRITRDTSRVPLVSVIFNIDKTGIDHVTFDGLEVDVSTNPKQFVNFDLFFNLVQTDDRLVVECEYNTDLHDRTTILGWLAAYEQLIESAISDHSATLGDLEIVGGDERRKLLEDWNATDAPLPTQPSIHRMIEEQVDRTQDAIALRAYGRTFTYGQLDGHANALSKTLRENGAARETLVGVCADRSPEMLVAILAVLKAGAAYVPIDPKYPAERIAYILQDSKAPLLLTQRALSGSLPQTEGTRSLFIDDCLTQSAWREASGTQPAELAYVIYTSGSTGQPKGVAIEHRNATAFIDWAKTIHSGEELSGVLFSTSICFDLSVFEMFVTLSSGGAVILAANALDLKNHPHLADITLINTVPSAISELVDAKLVPPSVKVVNLAGEALPTALVDRIYGETSVAKVHDLYGPSEDTTYSTYTLRKAGETASIGRPITNTRAYVLDPNGKLLPPGVPGELHLGGAGLARGYLHRPELTDAKFIRDPFSTDPSARLYKTGDLVRHFENGELQFLGRLDHQVKLRGYRIELGEIESLLTSHPSVEQAVATVHEGKIAAYLKTSGSPSGEGTTIWENQWDLLYSSALEQSGGGQLDRLDSVIAGWAGVENLEAQVTEWIDTTIDRIRNYGGRRILEIGCGTGQILSRLAPDAEAYWAADISQVAIEALRKNHPQPQVTLFHRPADDFSGIPDGHFDTVIINSVAQYFPSAAYLADVLEKAALTLRPGGRIFLGDIQSNALLPVHHAESLAARAPVGTTSGQLREKVALRLAGETELSLDPDWFTHLRGQLPSLSHTEILLRRGKVTNETNIYHYDVVLHVGQVPSLLPAPAATPWKNLNLEQLEALLMDSREPLHLTGIPDARLASALAFHHALEQGPADAPLPQATPALPSAVSAEDLSSVAENLGFRAHVRWQGDGTAGLLEAILIPRADTSLPAWPERAPERSAEASANQPASAGNKANAELSSILRGYLGERLPDYMVPASFTVLESLPLTPNGKIDRKALPAPFHEDDPSSAREILPPRTDTERQLVEIWKQVLGKTDVGIGDDIFDLGGDSILIFQITTRATRAGISITPAQVFRQRTIAGLSSAPSPTEGDIPLPIQRVNRDAYRRKN